MSTTPAIDPKTAAAPATAKAYGSDSMAAAMRALGLKYVALNPGASYRGLHDSIVNYLGDVDPKMLVCLHEEAAVALAHGYAKVAGKPMGAIVHSNVGLMHATMAIFDAWCDRMPVVVFGATGPWDAAVRRPWIDWIHTSTDQGGLVRNFTKWDDQPGSVRAAVESVMRGGLLASTAPRGPVYINFDAGLQEEETPLVPIPDTSRFDVPTYGPAAAQVAEVAKLLANAKSPLILAGRVSRNPEAWKQRIALAERLGAKVLTDSKVAAAFPSHHPLHPVPPTIFIADAAKKLVADADVVLSLDWVDLGGALRSAFGSKVTAKVINVSLDFTLHRGWNAEYQILPTVDVALACEPDDAVAALLEKLGPGKTNGTYATKRAPAPYQPDAKFGLRDVANTVNAALAGRKRTIVRSAIGWATEDLYIDDPLDFLGGDGGGGVGSGPGISVGAALALRDLHPDRFPMTVLGDGDFLMGATGIWTAVSNDIPLLVIVANNRSYFNDELHQQRMAEVRGRDASRRWIGQRIGEPPVDIATMARSMGALGIGPVDNKADFEKALREGIAAVDAGKVCVIDTLVLPAYAMDTTAMTSTTSPGGERGG
jgi:thiamine pyrophosphate-dependent acetolactate synthase large subunit-like protein